MMIIALIINTLVLMLAVLLNYEALNFLSRLLPNIHLKPRVVVAIGVLGSITAHIVEIVIFAAVIYFQVNNGNFGNLSGNFYGNFLDCVYFSFTNYTTLGYGDIVPHGHLRFLVGVEAVTGLVLITWSASFMFIEIQRFWHNSEAS
jgi:hypothetical protein